MWAITASMSATLTPIRNVDSPFFARNGAKVTIVAFSDFQCPFCGRVNPTLAKLLETYPGKVRVAFKHMPLRIHPDAPAAHAAAEAAGRQGKFWEMYDKIFANQRELAPEKFKQYATELNLDAALFEKDSADPAIKAKADASGLFPATSTPAEFAVFIRKEAERWSAVVRETGMKYD